MTPAHTLPGWWTVLDGCVGVVVTSPRHRDAPPPHHPTPPRPHRCNWCLPPSVIIAGLRYVLCHYWTPPPPGTTTILILCFCFAWPALSPVAWINLYYTALNSFNLQYAILCSTCVRFIQLTGSLHALHLPTYARLRRTVRRALPATARNTHCILPDMPYRLVRFRLVRYYGCGWRHAAPPSTLPACLATAPTTRIASLTCAATYAYACYDCPLPLPLPAVCAPRLHSTTATTLRWAFKHHLAYTPLPTLRRGVQHTLAAHRALFAGRCVAQVPYRVLNIIWDAAWHACQRCTTARLQRLFSCGSYYSARSA